MIIRTEKPEAINNYWFICLSPCGFSLLNGCEQKREDETLPILRESWCVSVEVLWFTENRFQPRGHAHIKSVRCFPSADEAGGETYLKVWSKAAKHLEGRTEHMNISQGAVRLSEHWLVLQINAEVLHCSVPASLPARSFWSVWFHGFWCSSSLRLKVSLGTFQTCSSQDLRLWHISDPQIRFGFRLDKCETFQRLWFERFLRAVSEGRVKECLTSVNNQPSSACSVSTSKFSPINQQNQLRLVKQGYIPAPVVSAHTNCTSPVLVWDELSVSFVCLMAAEAWLCHSLDLSLVLVWSSVEPD